MIAFVLLFQVAAATPTPTLDSIHNFRRISSRAIVVAIGCMLYNLVAGWVGGIEIELGEADPEA